MLTESNLSTPAVSDAARAAHTRVGEIITFVCEQNHEAVGLLQWRQLGAEAEILDLAVAGIIVATVLPRSFCKIFLSTFRT
jgi:hypothetical protein